MAVSLTALVLLVTGVPASDQPATENARSQAAIAPEDSSPTATTSPNSKAVTDDTGTDGPVADHAIDDDEVVRPEKSIVEATTTIRRLLNSFYALWPKIVIALLVVLSTYLLGLAVRFALRRGLQRWEKIEAASILVRIGLLLLGIGVGLSVIAGDARTLVGSVGLVGLALSWALQTPIESFTGWVLNAFRSYYRPGDRIEVGAVYGEVHRVDLLTTTVWQLGGPGKPVTAAQSTGAFVTFPNWEILRSNIVNYTRDFPYVFDEVTMGIANESDLEYAVAAFRRVAVETLGKMMREPAQRYARLLEHEQVSSDVEPEPQVYLSLEDAWTNCTVRYLVPVGERRKWSSKLIIALAKDMSRPEHGHRLMGAYPRQEVDVRQVDPREGHAPPE